MEATNTLLEHGVLGAVIVLQSGLIYYLLGRVKDLTDKMISLAANQEEIQAHLLSDK
jgi:hypothetical protein